MPAAYLLSKASTCPKGYRTPRTREECTFVSKTLGKFNPLAQEQDATQADYEKIESYSRCMIIDSEKDRTLYTGSDEKGENDFSMKNHLALCVKEVPGKLVHVVRQLKSFYKQMSKLKSIQ